MYLNDSRNKLPHVNPIPSRVAARIMITIGK